MVPQFTILQLDWGQMIETLQNTYRKIAHSQAKENIHKYHKCIEENKKEVMNIFTKKILKITR